MLERAWQAGVNRILAVGSDLRSSHTAVALAHRHEPVYAAVGIHPHEAARFEREAEEVRSLMGANKVVAIGEIGLDYYRQVAPREVQIEAFRQQLAWAGQTGLPASVHNREADDEVLETIRESGALAVLHCFSGTREMARCAIERGHYISFAGNLTFPRAAPLRDIAGNVALDQVMIESDAPVLAPQPWRGRRNEPAYVRSTLETLAAVHDVAFEAAAQAVTENAHRIFGWGME